MIRSFILAGLYWVQAAWFVMVGAAKKLRRRNNV